MKKPPLIEGNYYHIYNRGNNREDLFYEDDNYNHFLRLYDKYIEPVAETYAWCLLRNHFHVLVYLKTQKEINAKSLTYSTVEKPQNISATKQFSHLFNSYAQALNKRRKRSGSLFSKNFERKIVTSETYFQKLIFYIHNNPVHHGFTDRLQDYAWSSYHSVVSGKPTKLKRKRVIEMFNDIDNFKYYHSINPNLDSINDLMID